MPAADRREQLLSTARAVFARRGFHETSMNDVAIEAGVTKPVLYQHFASKRELFGAVLEDVGVRMEAAVVGAAAEAGAPRDQVRRGFGAYLHFAEHDPDGFRLLFTGDSRQDPEWAEIAARVERRVAQSVAGFIDVSGIEAERRVLLAHGLVGMSEGMVRHWLSTGTNLSDAEPLIDDLTALAWGGLRGLRGDQG